jgi:ectoine hydroxylase-related dioxygenase (phytanoyl-CoA dioxygenase family)
MAYYSPGERYLAITFWVPLQDVSEKSGAMQFIPGSHRGRLYEHRPINNDPKVHALEIVGRSFEREAVVCPLRIGGCTIHPHMTLHATGPNLTAEPRRAYAVGFGVRTRRSVIRKPFPWNERKQTARDERFLASLSSAKRAKHALKLGLIRIGLY